MGRKGERSLQVTTDNPCPWCGKDVLEYNDGNYTLRYHQGSTWHYACFYTYSDKLQSTRFYRNWWVETKG
jgi:hypothetical protein